MPKKEYCRLLLTQTRKNRGSKVILKLAARKNPNGDFGLWQAFYGEQYPPGEGERLVAPGLAHRRLKVSIHPVRPGIGLMWHISFELESFEEFLLFPTGDGKCGFVG